MAKKSGRMRKSRRKARKAAEEQAARSDGQEQPAGGGLIETHDDIRLLGRLQKRRDWVIPETAFEEVPANLVRLATDPNQRSQIQINASKELRGMHSSNLGRDKSEIGITFNPSVQGALAPQPPARPDDGEPMTYHRPAFVEAISAEDAEATLKVLQELRLEHQVIDQQSLPEGKQGPLN